MPSTSLATWCAAQLAESRTVLDAACGEGYGTGLLAGAGARSAVGVDVDEPTVAHARAKYPAAEFIEADVRQLPFEDGAFELIVSFETIEHVSDPELCSTSSGGVLTDDGLLLISTPNKHRYLVDNEFHQREFEHEEFVELLEARFPEVEVLLQHNWLVSGVLPAAEARDASGGKRETLASESSAESSPGGELYAVALCAKEELPHSAPSCSRCWSGRGTRARAAACGRRADRRAVASRIRSCAGGGLELARRLQALGGHAAWGLRLRLVAHDGSAALARRPR